MNSAPHFRHAFSAYRRGMARFPSAAIFLHPFPHVSSSGSPQHAQRIGPVGIGSVSSNVGTSGQKQRAVTRRGPLNRGSFRGTSRALWAPFGRESGQLHPANPRIAATVNQEVGGSSPSAPAYDVTTSYRALHHALLSAIAELSGEPAADFGGLTARNAVSLAASSARKVVTSCCSYRSVTSRIPWPM